MRSLSKFFITAKHKDCRDIKENRHLLWHFSYLNHLVQNGHCCLLFLIFPAQDGNMSILPLKTKPENRQTSKKLRTDKYSWGSKWVPIEWIKAELSTPNEDHGAGVFVLPSISGVDTCPGPRTCIWANKWNLLARHVPYTTPYLDTEFKLTTLLPLPLVGPYCWAGWVHIWGSDSMDRLTKIKLFTATWLGRFR